MTLFGISLRKPGFDELTAAAVMGTGLWVLATAVARWLQPEMSAADAGALLVVTLWGALSARCGIRVGQGSRHLLANLAVSALLLGVYQAAWALGH